MEIDLFVHLFRGKVAGCTGFDLFETNLNLELMLCERNRAFGPVTREDDLGELARRVTKWTKPGNRCDVLTTVKGCCGVAR